MREIKHKIKQLRPPLRQVAPLTWYIVLGFGALNLLLGASLVYYPAHGLAIISQYTPSWAYGAVSFVLGLAMLYGAAHNNWKLMRRCMLFGVLLKTVWLFALFILFLHGGNTYIISLWLFLTYIQAMAYIFFGPLVKGGGRADDVSGRGGNSPRL